MLRNADSASCLCRACAAGNLEVVEHLMAVGGKTLLVLAMTLGYVGADQWFARHPDL